MVNEWTTAPVLMPFPLLRFELFVSPRSRMRCRPALAEFVAQVGAGHKVRA